MWWPWPRRERSHQRWFNTSCFIRPSGRGDEGNSSRVHYFGPGSNTWDLTLTKGFRFGGSRQAQLRAEFYNLFNHPTWQTVNNVARFDPAGNQINDAFGTVMPDGSQLATYPDVYGRDKARLAMLQGEAGTVTAAAK